MMGVSRLGIKPIHVVMIIVIVFVIVPVTRRAVLHIMAAYANVHWIVMLTAFTLATLLFGAVTLRWWVIMRDGGRD